MYVYVHAMFIYVCIIMYVYTEYMYVSFHVCTQVCVFVCIYVYMYISMYVCMYVWTVWIEVCMYICMHACMYVCMHAYGYACMHMYVCMYAWMNEIAPTKISWNSTKQYVFKIKLIISLWTWQAFIHVSNKWSLKKMCMCITMLFCYITMYILPGMYTYY